MNRVSIVECSEYEEGIVFDAVSDAVDRIGFELPQGKRVLVKPNIMSQNRPDQHTVTHYMIVDSLCRLLKERGNDIMIGDSISFFQKGLTEKAFKTTGIEGVARKYGARLVCFEDVDLARFTRKDGSIESLDELFIPRILLDVDMVINACKLKTHSAMRFSGAIKNMYGCLPGGYKQKIHRWSANEYELSDVFVDICRVVKPQLSIMDAVVGLDGGPTALGRKVRTGMVVASENPAALDVVASSMIGYEAGELPILLQARKRGLISDFDDIDVIGERRNHKFKRLVKKDLDRSFNSDSLLVKHTYVDLAVDTDMCKRSGKCMDACPVGAIGQRDGHVTIDVDRCISCYGCLSLCPNDAIGIRPTFMNRLGWALRRVTGL